MVQPFDKLQTEVCSPVAWRRMESSSSVRVWVILRSTSDILVKNKLNDCSKTFRTFPDFSDVFERISNLGLIDLDLQEIHLKNVKNARTKDLEMNLINRSSEIWQAFHQKHPQIFSEIR